MLFALIGGAAVVLGFLALPMINAGPLGSYPAIQLASILSAAGAPADSPLAIYLWLLVIAGVLIALVAGVSWVSSGRSGRPPQGTDRLIVAGAAVGGLISMAVLIGAVQSAGLQNILAVVGSGFWLMVAGFVVALIGVFV